MGEKIGKQLILLAEPEYLDLVNRANAVSASREDEDGVEIVHKRPPLLHRHHYYAVHRNTIRHKYPSGYEKVKYITLWKCKVCDKELHSRFDPETRKVLLITAYVVLGIETLTVALVALI